MEGHLSFLTNSISNICSKLQDKQENKFAKSAPLTGHPSHPELLRGLYTKCRESSSGSSKYVSTADMDWWRRDHVRHAYFSAHPDPKMGNIAGVEFARNWLEMKIAAGEGVAKQTCAINIRKGVISSSLASQGK
jgi:hypothetical protein